MEWWTWPSPLLTIGVITFSYIVARAIYNVFFHPLHTYPGPWLRGASRLPYTISIFRGHASQRVKDVHEKYGHVVRKTPDTLSYTCGQAWSGLWPSIKYRHTPLRFKVLIQLLMVGIKDVYGTEQSDKRGNISKDPNFYIKPPDNVDTISTANDADHRRLRRLQSHAFSKQALLQQEAYLQQYTQKFIRCIGDEAKKHNGVVDIMKWANFLTTDLIGDLSFGESFGGLEGGKLHPWLENIFTTLKTFTFMREIIRLPQFVVKAAMACIPKAMIKHQKKAVSFGAEAAMRRMALDTDRPDIMSYILWHRGDEEKGMSLAEIEMAAITFIVAGSETTATMISGTVYLLLRHPAVLLEATRRIRADFPAKTDLTSIKLQQHEYLNALLKEGLRLYPPAPDMLFRATTNESAIVAGQVVPPGTGLKINLLAANRSQRNFHRPLEFVPERWIKDAPAEFHEDVRDVLKPFSIGPMDCLGKNLAWAEIRMILGYILWNFDLVGLESDSQNWIERQKIYSLWEKLPLNVKISARDIKATQRLN